MAPLPFLGNKDESKDRIMEIISGVKRLKIVQTSDSYVHAEFRTGFLRFVDDVEFSFDVDASFVYFRSASRMDYHDFSLNRRRTNEISTLHLET